MRTQLRKLTALAAVAMSAILGLPAPAAADTWNERTQLTFTEPVKIPGATLQPGTYTFKLSNHEGNRHLVQVFKGEQEELIALTQAIPIRRSEPTGETVLTFNPTDQGVPALKAWYYPHSAYGHQFIYPEEEARHIAERSKTIVLSVDVEGTDLSKGSLRLYHPTGTRSEWRADPATETEWRAWQQQRAASTGNRQERGNGDGDAADGRDRADAADSRAPMMMTDPPAMRVALDDIESNPSKYTGKAVSVDAEVEEVFGPRLFTIDEPHWGDMDGEVLVYAPSALAALITDDDRVTVSGTLRTIALAEIEREWGWFQLDPEVEVEFLEKPVLIADRIVGGDNNVAMLLDLTSAANKPASPSAGASSVIMDPGAVGAGTTDLVGHRVDLKNVRVLRMAQHEGFFIDAPDGPVLVLPADGVPVTVRPGDTVSLQGAIADLPDRAAERVNPPSDWNRQIYVVATSVSK